MALTARRKKTNNFEIILRLIADTVHHTRHSHPLLYIKLSDGVLIIE
jgi:hypothetical protein